MSWLIGKPVLLDLHRAEVGQGRAQPHTVVPGQPVDHVVLGLAPRRLPLDAIRGRDHTRALCSTDARKEMHMERHMTDLAATLGIVSVRSHTR